MLMGAAGKGIRQVVGYIDENIIKPVVERQYVYNMRYVDDPAIKGDAQVVPRGAVNLAVKEASSVRRLEFLNMTANPYDIEIVGKTGRTAILREVVKGLQLPVDDIIPTYEKEQFAASLQQQGSKPGTQAVDASGAPKGGQEGNVVRNRQSNMGTQ